MRTAIILAVCLGALSILPGCLGRFASNQGRRQAARSADYYMRTYVEPEVANDPESRDQFRQARNDAADAIVRTGNDRQVNRVGVNDRGWLTEER